MQMLHAQILILCHYSAGKQSVSDAVLENQYVSIIILETVGLMAKQEGQGSWCCLRFWLLLD